MEPCDLKVELCDLKIKLIPLKTRVELYSLEEYIPSENPVEEMNEFYEAFVRSVEEAYGSKSKENIAFRVWYRDCKEYRTTVDALRVKIKYLLKSTPELVFMSYNKVLPYLYPLSTENEVDRANQFIERVKSAFPNNFDDPARIFISVQWFQDGRATLEQMTGEVLRVLGNKNDLIEAYMEFVPQAQNFSVPQAQNFRIRDKFLSNPVVGGLLGAFAVGAIGLFKIMK